MGFNVARSSDRMDWPESNPEHWESQSLALYNEDLLDRLRGGWNAPPDLPDEWVHGAELRNAPDPADALESAYPDPGPTVWKDPRLCLLLPFWRTVMPAPIAVVFVWRSPLAVAHSLHRRDRLTVPEGLALWERYNRSAVEGLDGLDTFVVSFESVVRGPSESMQEIASWLDSLEQFGGSVGGWDLAGATAAIIAELDHQPAQHAVVDDSVLLIEQRELVDHLSSLHGIHRPLHAHLPGSESPWTTSVLQLRLSNPNREFDAVKEELRIARDEVRRTRDDAYRALSNIQASTSWRLTRPLRTATAKFEELRDRFSSR